MKLNEEQKQFIVTRYAVFRLGWEICQEFKARFGVEVPLDQVRHYHIGRSDAGNARLGFKKWKPLFDETRAKFIEETGAMAIANASYRIARLDEMFNIAFQKKNYHQAAKLLEQAAKETGGGFTNKREVVAEIDATVSTESSIPSDVQRDMLSARIRDAVRVALEAGATTQAAPAVTH
mgnify:FL=1